MALTVKSPERLIAKGFVQQSDLSQRLLFFQQQAHNPLAKKSSCSCHQAAYPSQGHRSGLLLGGELAVSWAWFSCWLSSCLREWTYDINLWRLYKSKGVTRRRDYWKTNFNPYVKQFFKHVLLLLVIPIQKNSTFFFHAKNTFLQIITNQLN